MEWWVWLIIGVVAFIVLLVIFVGGDDDPPPPSGGNRKYSGDIENKNTSSSPLSDERLKENITPLSGALEKVLTLQGVSYDWRHQEYPELGLDNKKHIGFVAQQLENVLPDLISENEGDFKRVNYMELVALLTEAIKEQQKQIDELRKSSDKK